MEDFDTRSRRWSRKPLRFLAFADGYVMCRPYHRAPIAITKNEWLTMKVWEEPEKVKVKGIPAQSTIEAVFAVMDKPKSIAQLGEDVGIAGVTARRCVKILKEQKRVHIAAFDTGYRGCDRTSLWIAGEGEDAVRPGPQTAKERHNYLAAKKAGKKPSAAEIRERKRQEQIRAEVAKLTPHRDPLTAAFFGSSELPTGTLANLPSRVFRQSMDISDELEAA